MFTRSVYEYSDYRSLLRDYYQFRKKEKPNWSFGVWARQLGLKSPSTLIMILNGQRNPGRKLVHTFIQHFKFDKRESAYFEDLVRLHKVKKDVRLSVLLMERLGKQHPSGNFKLLDSETFLAISNWYYYAIREMVLLRDFKEDPDWISRRLFFSVTPKQIKTAIETLIHLGLLKRTDDGALIQSVSTIDTDHTINDEGLKRFHEQMLEHAKTAIRSQAKDHQRFVAGFTLAFNEQTIEKAHELIEKFRMDMLNLAESDDQRDEVFQFEAAFFSLTDRSKRGNLDKNTLSISESEAASSEQRNLQ